VVALLAQRQIRRSKLFLQRRTLCLSRDVSDQLRREFTPHARKFALVVDKARNSCLYFNGLFRNFAKFARVAHGEHAKLLREASESGGFWGFLTGSKSGRG
jgi:hypothetical protein